MRVISSNSGIKNISRVIRQKYFSFTYRLRRGFIKPFVSLIRHYEIREDFLEIYKAHVEELYRNPKLKKRTVLSKKKWEERISGFREDSVKIDPREFISKFLDNMLVKLKFVKELLRDFLKIVG